MLNKYAQAIAVERLIKDAATQANLLKQAAIEQEMYVEALIKQAGFDFGDAMDSIAESDLVQNLKEKYGEHGKTILNDALAGTLAGAGIGGMASLMGDGSLLSGLGRGAMLGGTGGAILGGLTAANKEYADSDMRDQLLELLKR